ncbi:MAG: FecR domain-containing protein, partial [Deltaproteobacteria bacterium]|nr:FecR domain-containing protein [Deltaproteobacteria bacterium]
MKTMKRWMGLLVCLFLTAVAMVPLSPAADESAMVVGRIYYIEGDLLRYVPEEKDWVAAVRDAPFGTEDALFSGSRGMAELIVPNGTWVRTGNNTQIQFITLDADLSQMDVASGVARFYNKGSDTVIKATSPFGYVLAYPGTVFDFYVGDNSVEVVAVRGKVSFVHSETDARYDVAAGSPSILADQQQVSSGEGTVDPDWNRWNTVRENFWTAKARVRGR